MLPSQPPTAGPITNPKPNTALIRPKGFARSSGFVTSVTYANAVDMLEVVMPEMMRPTKSHRSDGATAMKTQSMLNPKHEIRITGRLQKRSDQAPRIGEKINCMVDHANAK